MLATPSLLLRRPHWVASLALVLAASAFLPCPSAQAAAPTVAEWPEFRGPTGQGLTTATGLPTQWSTEKNVVWKTAVPGSGWSSPVVADGLIFLTTGLASDGEPPSLRALAFDFATGALRWNTEVFTPAETTTQAIHKKNSLASPTPRLEGDRIYVHFGHHGTACLDRNGRILWRNRDLGYEPVHGNGSSPLLAGDRLIFTADANRDPAVIALDRNTGQLAWRTPRAVTVKNHFSFATPLLITVHGRPQVIAPGSGAVMAYDPQNGRELWRVRYGNGYSVIPRPVFAHGLVFVATGFGKPDLLAIRPDGTGDVTATHIAWRTSKNAPLTPSLVVLGDELYAVSDTGIATCFDARTGRVHWEERLEGNYSASPLAADGRIYFQNEAGTGTVLRAGPTFAKLATNKLGERTFASYAVSGRSFLLRTERHLYRIATAGP